MLGWRRVVAVKQMYMSGWVEIEENISLMWCTMICFFNGICHLWCGEVRLRSYFFIYSLLM